MKKFFASFAVTITLLFAPIQKADAAVGIVATPAVLVVGGVVAAVGGVGLIDTLTDVGLICKLPGFDGFFSCFGEFVVGAALSVAGLVILDGQQTLAFEEVSPSMKHLSGVSAEEIAVYNSELDQLNAINAQITAEVSANKNLDASARWSEMSDLLAPATMKIAALNGQALLKSLQ
jgi:hypothetical protein